MIRSNPTILLRPSPGYTLFELLLVIAILSALTVAAGIRLTRPIHRAREEAARNRWVLWDRQLRVQAQRTGTMIELQIRRDRQQLRITGAAQELWKANGDPGCFPRQMRIASSGSPNEDVRIVYRPDGTANSYAVSWEDTRHPQAWFFIVGRTGQTCAIHSEGQLDALFSQLADRLDAH